MKELSSHVTNINRVFKNIKSEVMADLICIENSGLVIITNKVASVLDLQTIEKYVKNIYNIELNHMESPRLSQSKSFLKIIGIPYISEFTNICISIEEVEKIIKENHIFNNVILASRPRIIKVSPKLDILIIWIDIWDAQSVKIIDDGLYFIFPFHFILFLFSFFFYFSIFRTTWVRVYQSCCHISHKLMA